jgi:hypothetical protein
LDGLAQREVDGAKVILPIWVGVDEHQVRKYSPSLADRVAIRWDDGLANAVIKLVEVIKPEAIEKFYKKDWLQLSLINSGKEILNIAVGCHFSYSFHDDMSLMYASSTFLCKSQQAEQMASADFAAAP